MFASPQLFMPTRKQIVASESFIGATAQVASGYSGGNSTLSVNGGTDLPACLFVCGWCSADGDPSTFQIGATALTKVTGSDTRVSLWVCEYAGGSDTFTYGPGTGHVNMLVASGWRTGGYQDTQISAQKLTFGSVQAVTGTRAHLESVCAVPSGGVGFIVAATDHAALNANAPNWTGVEVSPAASDSGGATQGRISLACTNSSGNWDPEFWGSGASGWNFAVGMTACAFNT